MNRPPLRCRLFGHASRIIGMNGHLPTDTWFGFVQRCRRCGEDTSLVVSTTRVRPNLPPTFPDANPDKENR